MRDRSYLIKNAYFPFSNNTFDILMDNGVINKIEKNLQCDVDTKVIDLQNRMVINGFVDGHMHLDKALIGDTVINQSGTLSEAITIMGNYKNKMTRDEVKERARKVIDLAFEKGTRFFRTHVDIDDHIGLKSLEALLELKEEYQSKIELQLVAFPQEGINANPNNLAYLEEALKMGTDLIGGIPANEEDPVEHMKKIFSLAMKYNVDIDMHIDETDDPKSLTIKDLAKMTIENGYLGRVTAGHCCSLAANHKEDILPIIDLIKEARINIISLPSTNLYLQGRNDPKNIRRGITPVKFLLENGVGVMIASDNIRDPFNPFGNGNLLEEGLIAAHGCHMGGEDDLNKVFDMLTINPGELLNFNYGIKVGQRANFIVVDATTKAHSIIRQSGIYGYVLGNHVSINN